MCMRRHSPGRLYTGRGNGLQSDDRCVMRQRTGAGIRRKDIQQRNTTSQHAGPRNSISGMSSLLLSVCIWRFS